MIVIDVDPVATAAGSDFMMQRDLERIERIKSALVETHADALLCALPSNVLLISGYWPVVGTAIAIITSDGSVAVVVPSDEEELASVCWADAKYTFSTGSLEQLASASDSVRGALGKALKGLGLNSTCRLAHEDCEAFEPVSYAGMHFYRASLPALIHEIAPSIRMIAADDMLARLRARLTPKEIENVRGACRLAKTAFKYGAARLRCGLHETAAAILFREALSSPDAGDRAGGFVYCMSGPNSADAYRSYQRSQFRSIGGDDLVLIHCNSYRNGFWTDITRTFWVPLLDDDRRRMYEAVFAARDAALKTIRAGVAGNAVDKSAREVLSDYGFGKEFKHGLGHGVGFAAINHHAIPRLHPASTDTLEAGMVFNIEPAIYFEGSRGLRHCDMVLVTEHGHELLTPFQSTTGDLLLR